ncbi:MAG: CRISPR-associated protein Csx16 [Bacilli bacterium]
MHFVIVSRHVAAIEFVRKSDPRFADAPAMAHATEADVRRRVVAGNLPLSLAALADEVVAVEFTGRPPRGEEYTLEDMVAAGARLQSYVVFRGADEAPLTEFYDPGSLLAARELKELVAKR